MKKLASYLHNEWKTGTGDGASLYNPTTEVVIARASSDGLDLGAAVSYARDIGGAALRELGFAQRGALLAKLSDTIHKRRDELIALAVENGGNTRGDAKFDVDGATATLQHYAELGKTLGERRVIADGPTMQLGRNPRWIGVHAWSSAQGVAVHVNAYNFPAWNMMEKAAVALLAGVPVVTKPAQSTLLVAHRIVEAIVEDKVLPAGALSLVSGGIGKLFDALGPQDAIAFTGSAQTGTKIRTHESVVRHSVRLNVEADSLNSAVLGPDVEQGSATYEMFLRELAKEVTQKSGQKCTATRRVFVNEAIAKDVERDLCERLSEVVVGDPSHNEVKMGPLVTAQQLADVRAGIATLQKHARVACGGDRGKVAHAEKGWFIAPTLLVANDAGAAPLHDVEVFGPVTTLIAYKTPDDAAKLVRRGQGSLVGSVYSDDEPFCESMLHGIAAAHGRLYFGSEKIAEHTFGPGTVLAGLVHGGPGRAGGGEELGGVRGLEHYMQRTAIQGSKPTVERLLGIAAGGAA
ncbi:MAG: 3,4-dehydroadipyl-CoA semialdehyde dehydrogenase [Deltaproteobacteria bacterium]|nr:3,4-dehydroadipyl-CoA semialdehyde dehydrogenase [Deltaproteobacteria bacterium]